MFYYFRRPSVYSYLDFVRLRRKEDFSNVELSLFSAKKKIVDSFFSEVDSSHDKIDFYIKPQKPLFLDALDFYLYKGECGGFEDGFKLDFYSLVSGFFVCSKRFKDFIEKRDPGVHSFWRIKVEGVDVEYYFMFVGRLIVFDKNKIERCSNVFINSECDKRFLESIDGVPIWTLKNETDGFFFSKNFKDEITKEGFLGFGYPREMYNVSRDSMPEFYDGFKMVGKA